MKLKGNVLVLRHLYENQRAIELKQKPPHRILCVGSSGGMKSVRIAGYLTALQDEGLTEPFDWMLAVSGSAGPFGAYLCKIAHRVHLVFEHLAEPKAKFVSGRLPRIRIRLSYLESVLNGAIAPLWLGQDLIAAHRTALWIALTERSTGALHFADAREPPGVVSLACATMAGPNISDAQYKLNGKEMVDGACATPFPIIEGMKKFRPTDVLALSSQIHPKYSSWVYKKIWSMIARGWLLRETRLLRRNTALMDVRFAHEADRAAEAKRIRVCRITPTIGDARLTFEGNTLPIMREGWNEARRFMQQLLAEARPVREI